jgi:hypothetical protein
MDRVFRVEVCIYGKSTSRDHKRRFAVKIRGNSGGDAQFVQIGSHGALFGK